MKSQTQTKNSKFNICPLCNGNKTEKCICIKGYTLNSIFGKMVKNENSK